MRLPVDWAREFADLPADARALAGRLGACGFGVEQIEDEVVDLEITANRPDCLSVYGLAREAAAAFDVELRPIPLAALPSGGAAAKSPVAVSIADAGCGRYALAIVDVVVRPSPEWLARRLIAAGIRPINNVVDITNYVMLEMGQPMHAFDAATIAGPEIRVRRARADETLATLDNQTRRLDETMLVIADRERAVALAGVMGGAATEVTAGTTRIALESAWFRPTTVRAMSRRLALKTEASMRFERGADIEAPVAAIARALALFERTDSGRPAAAVTDVYPRRPAAEAVPLRADRIARVLGDAVPGRFVEDLLPRLGFSLTPAAGGWRVQVPSFRVDVSREVDLIEEVGRHWGFDRIPATFPALSDVPRPSDAAIARGRLVRRLLCGAGLQEAVTFTFIDAAAAAPFGDAARPLAIKNPLSEKFAVLRPSLVPGLAESLVYNRNRQMTDVRLFEVGTVFEHAHGERTCAGWVLAGSRGEHWSGSAGPLAFPDTKGLAELVASAFGTTIHAEAADDLAFLARGQRARLRTPQGAIAGWIGRLARVEGMDEPVYAGELVLSVIDTGAAGTMRALAPLPRFPSVVRDLSIVVDERLPAADVRDTIRTNAPPILASVREFDRYQGRGIPAGRVSLSVRLTFRDADRTLTDGEVQRAVDDIVRVLARDHGAVLRGQ